MPTFKRTLFSLGVLLLGISTTNLRAQISRDVTIPPSGRGELMRPTIVDFSALPDVAPQIKGQRTNPFRPTIPLDLYRSLKSQPPVSNENITTPDFHINPRNATLVKGFDGLDQNQSADGGFIWSPSDCNGAVSPSYYVEITNAAIGVYSRGGTNKSIKPLSAFFGYTTKALFDPQVKYDPLWGRWIVSATAFPEDADHMWLFVSVSTTSNPLGTYYTYPVNVAFHSNDFFDYQKIGLTQDAVLFSANIFNGNNFNGATLAVVPKAYLYNGLPIAYPRWDNLRATLTLPLVQDSNPKAYLIFDQPGSKNVGVYTLTNAAFPAYATLSAPVNVSIGVTQNYPPAANQPGTTVTVETLDVRYPNNSVQVGDTVYAANTINSSKNKPIVNVFGINCATKTKVFQQNIAASSTSHDFIPSVSVNTQGDLAVAWTSTMWATGVGKGFPAVYVSGKLASAATFGTPKRLRTSTEAYTAASGSDPARWGDYTALNVDPTNGINFFGVNQYNKNGTTWGTYIFNILVN